MRKLTLCVAVLALVAAPALAERTIEPLSSIRYMDYGTGQVRTGPVYQDLATAGWFNAGQTNYPMPVADDIHGTGPDTIVSMTIGYVNEDATTGTFVLPVTFYTNTASDGVIPGAGAVPIASFSITLPYGAFIIANIPVPNVAVGTDFWFEAQYGGFQTAGPILTGNPAGTVGYSHDIFAQTSTTWNFESGTWADFTLGFVPEPASIGLLAVSGLLMLRRRR
jgi:hypothetical protein